MKLILKNPCLYKGIQNLDTVFSTTDFIRITGCQKIQITHWIDNNAIKPYKDAKGRGNSRVLSAHNLLEALICKELCEVGVLVRNMAMVLAALREKWMKFPSAWSFFVETKCSYIAIDFGGEKPKVSNLGSGVTVDVAPIIKIITQICKEKA